MGIGQWLLERRLANIRRKMLFEMAFFLLGLRSTMAGVETSRNFRRRAVINGARDLRALVGRLSPLDQQRLRAKLSQEWLEQDIAEVRRLMEWIVDVTGFGDRAKPSWDKVRGSVLDVEAKDVLLVYDAVCSPEAVGGHQEAAALLKPSGELAGPEDISRVNEVEEVLRRLDEYLTTT